MVSATKTAEKHGNTKYYINSAICLIIMFGFGYLPPVAPITTLGMQILGIFLGMVYGWIFVEIAWPSLAGLVALTQIGYMSAADVLKASFGESNVVLMFFIFIFCGTFAHYGLSRIIAVWSITRKAVLGRPWVFTFVFLMVMAFLGGVTSATPTIVIGWSLAYVISEQCGFKKGDSYPLILIFGTALIAQLGDCIIPFKSIPLLVMGVYESLAGSPIPLGSYMLIVILATMLCIIAYLFIANLIFRPDMKSLKELNAETLMGEDGIQMNKVQKITLLFLILLMVMMLLPGFFPSSTFPLIVFLKKLGSTGICILLVGLMCLMRVDGAPIINFKKMVGNVEWNSILLLAAAIPVANIMSNEASGFPAALQAFISPMATNTSPFVFVILIGLVATLITNVMTNGPVGMILMAAVYAAVNSVGMNPTAAVVTVVMCVHIAVLFPSGSSTAALINGNEWIGTKNLWKIGPMACVLCWLIISVIAGVLGL
ncbi:hypothetical protein B5E84_16015 [Lachnoclostridium sp. An14]|uniref:SLC13 family permease n=1 Tax=Lachnoclostridium sp. An14 TaxID=1965562 RepID=UPI000B3A3740|nr:SLC13 family permease [Lachnoclostridium sp. An14]OUQ14683.1 hypothetical protein B5E84_16015 [Lachnoclostridium sp. An14]